MICRENQCTGFYMIGTSVMKVLIKLLKLSQKSEAWPAFKQTTKMEKFATIVNGFYSLTIAKKISILDIRVEPSDSKGGFVILQYHVAVPKIIENFQINAFVRVDFY